MARSSRHQHRLFRGAAGLVASALLLAGPVSSAIATGETVEPDDTTSAARADVRGAAVGVEARMRDHRGQDHGTNARNCIRYAPAGTQTSSGWVTAGAEALTAHGYSGRCGDTLNTSTQSAIGFKPASSANLTIGSASSLGEITHYNNPISSNDQYYSGVIDVRLKGVTDTDGNPDPVFSFPWTMNETPNDRWGNGDDFTKVTVQSPETVIVVDGKPYRMVVTGFADDCSTGTPKNEWWTPEKSTTTAQLCSKLTQVRSLEIVKQVEVPEGFKGEVPTFGFDSETTMTDLEGVKSYWQNDFSLSPKVGEPATTDKQDVLVPNQKVTVTEQAVEGWEVKDIICEGEGAVADVAAGKINFAGIEVDTVEALPAKCTFVNRPVVKPLTLAKTVTDPEYTQDWDWAITKTVSPTDTVADPQPSGTEFTYEVTVSPTPGKKTDGKYTTKLTLTNPNAFELKDVKLEDANCEVTEPNFDLAASETKEVTLSCTAPAVEGGTNTATITWTDPISGESSDPVSASADYSFEKAEMLPGEHAEVTIEDTFPEFAEQNPSAVVVGKDGSKTFTYTVTHTAPEGECKEVTNTAKIVETEQTATADAKVCNQADLGVSKNVITSLDRTYAWDIEKSVDKSKISITPDGEAKASYTVTVTEGAAKDDNWAMSGQITVKNPNVFRDAVVTVTDATSVGGECTVTDGENATIKAGETKVFDYTCAFTEKPASYDGTNTATVTWDGSDTPTTYTATFAEKDWQLNEKVKETTVSDTFPEFGALPDGKTLMWSAEGKEHVFTYEHIFTADELPAAGECAKVDNTASLSTGGEAVAQVELCVEAPLTVSKTVSGSYDLTHSWAVEKSASPEKQSLREGDKAMVDYDVVVTHTDAQHSNVKVSGTITVANPNAWGKDYSVADVFAGTECTVDGATGKLAAGESVDLTYTCEMPEAFEPGEADANVATVTTTGPDGQPVATTSEPAAVTWKITEHNDPVTVTDEFNGGAATTLGTITVGDDGTLTADPETAVVDGQKVTFSYEKEITDSVAGECTSYDNVAKVVGDDDATLAEDDATAEVCVEKELTIAKTVNGSYDLTHLWSVEKSVDPTKVEVLDGDSATLGYDVVVTHEGTETSNVKVSGTIELNNPNQWPKQYTVTDMFAGSVCEVTDGTGTIDAGATKELAYTCEVPAGFEPSDADANVAELTATGIDGKPMLAETDPVVVDWDIATHNNPVKVLDIFGDDEPTQLGTVEMTADGLTADSEGETSINGDSVTFGYTGEITDLPLGECTMVSNVAQVESDDKVLDEDDAVAEICTEDDLVVTKTVEANAEYTHNWKIDKSVAVSDFGKVKPYTEVTAKYEVTVTPEGSKVTKAMMTGEITVTNPNAYKDVEVAVTDVVSDDAWGCKVASDKVTVAAEGTETLTYECMLADGKEPAAEGTNEVTIEWGEGDDVQSTTYEQPYTVDITNVNDEVEVRDQFMMDTPILLGKAKWNADGTPKVFRYEKIIDVGNIPGNHEMNNVAWIAETDQKDQEKISFEIGKPLPPKTGAPGGAPAPTPTTTQPLVARRDD